MTPEEQTELLQGLLHRIGSMESHQREVDSENARRLERLDTVDDAERFRLHKLQEDSIQRAVEHLSLERDKVYVLKRIEEHLRKLK